MSDIQAQIEFLQSIAKVTEEFDAAYATRKEDNERWTAAKNAFQEQRSFWRSVNEANREKSEDTATVETVSAQAKVHIDPDTPVNEEENN